MISVRGILSHGGLRRGNPDSKVITGVYRSPGIAVHVPLNTLWEQHVLALEMQGLASFSFYTTPYTYDEEGQGQEIPGWRG